LKSVISGFGQELGVTSAGQAFCIKALHPSDPTTDVEGVPDQTSASTTMVNFQQTFVISNPGSVNNSWEGELYALPDPTIPMSYYVREGVSQVATCVPNTTLGNTVGDAISSWSRSFERWRLAYYGVTVYLDAPALANQGSVVACQYPSIPMVSSVTGDADQAGMPVPSHLVVRYQSGDTPGYDLVMQMPNSYSGQFKEGVYLPLKLDSNHAQWRTQNDLVFDGTAWASPNGNNHMIPLTNATNGGLYPGSTCLYFDIGTNLFGGSTHYVPAISNLGTICFKGISGEASVRVVIRMGYECMVQPGTAYTSFIKVSPGYDPAAIMAYFMISRQLKDAYPAEYNDLGRLWEVIKKAASIISPFIRMVPGVGNMIVSAGSAIGKGIDYIAKANKKGKREQLMSATDRAAVSKANARRIETLDMARRFQRTAMAKGKLLQVKRR
jgi:hypothetical protein